jgi:TolB-like protein/Flp pilus assembly protein TadD
MAPEQLEGKVCDARTDIFALGLVLYEMAAGKRAFVGDSRAALIAEIMRGEPPVLEGAPAGLHNVIRKCLAKGPGERYQTAAEALAAIEAVAPFSAGAGPPRGRARRWVLAGALTAMAIGAVILWRPWERLGGLPGRITAVAILPFENLSKEPDQEFFANGVQQQLITDLSKIRALRVISRNSVMQYRGTNKRLPEIARELGVDGVVEGSVMRSGNRLRITAELIDARTERHIWANSYDRDLREVLEMQREAARTIASEIRTEVTPEEKRQLAAARRVEPEVHELFLRGQYWANKLGEEDLNRAIDYFQRAIDRNQAYAPAYAGLAVCYHALSTAYRPPREVMPKAKAAAERAVELDETLVDAHLILARVLLFFDWDWPAAEKHLTRAMELSPSSAEAHITYGAYFTALGQSDRALVEFRLAQALDPLSLVIQTEILFSLITARQFDEVIVQAHRVLEREPNYSWGYALAALAYGEKGDFERALEAADKASKIDPNNTTFTAFRAHVQAAKGNRVEAEKLVAELKAVSSRRYVCAYEVAHTYVKLGDKDEAFKWLQKGQRERADCMVWLLCEPWMDPLRADPRYSELIDAIGLTGKAGSKP